MLKKTAEIYLDSIKDSDGWQELSDELGLCYEKSREYFEFGEYGSITIVVDENLNIIGGRVHKI